MLIDTAPILVDSAPEMVVKPEKPKKEEDVSSVFDLRIRRFC